MDSAQELQIELPATAEAIPRIRAAVEARALELGISERSLADLKTVISEACANVVRHAYEGDEPGPLEVELTPIGDRVRCRIRDRGCGIAPKPDAERPTLHMGLPLIGALSARFVLTSERGVGTELEIEVPLHLIPVPIGVVSG